MKDDEFVTKSYPALVNWISLDMNLISEKEGELLKDDYNRTGNLKNVIRLLGEEKATIVYNSLDENRKRFLLKNGFKVK